MQMINTDHELYFLIVSGISVRYIIDSVSARLHGFFMLSCVPHVDASTNCPLVSDNR